MAHLNKRSDITIDPPETPTSNRSTFKGSLEKYAYESPSSQTKATQLPTDSKQPAGSKASKRKPVEKMALQVSKRVTRSSASVSPLPQAPTSVTTKRKVVEVVAAPLSPASKKLKRPSSSYAPPRKYAYLENKLVDSLTPNLICVFIGVNPGISTATIGHAYAHASNLFWKLLHSSGCTPRRCAPKEDRDMPRLYALGLTNIVTRPTKDASELSKQEMDDGVKMLEQKTATNRPEAVCIVGKSIWESIWRVRHGRNIQKGEFKYGWQDEKMGVVQDENGPWGGARIFVATTTSGLAAGMRPAEKEEVWRELGEWVERRRAERAAEAVIEIPTDELS